MKTQTVIMAIILIGISWGGLIFLLVLAMRKEHKKQRGTCEK